jgi:hypothetical protein
MAAGISLVLLALQVCRFAAWSMDPCTPRGMVGWVWPMFALVPPYVWISLRLRGHADPKIIGRALSVAMWWGVVNFVVAVIVIASNTGLRRSPEVMTSGDLLGWFAYAGIQGILAISAGRAAWTMPGAESIWRLLFGSTVRVGLYLLVLLLIALVPQPMIGRQPSEEARAIGQLRMLGSGQQAYESLHPERGYAATVEELMAENFISPGAMVSTRWYRFTLTAGAQDLSGRISSYQAWATRLEPRHMCRSYFTDESGIIRVTKEDRPATAADRALQ